MKIIIPGDPEEQARMRHFVRGGFARCYDPKKKEKDALKFFLSDWVKVNFPGYKYPKFPKVSFYFYCTIPASMNKKMRVLAERGLVRKRTKPDVDNYIKLYFDCMNEILLEDDSHASIGNAEKLYHANPHTVIYIDECPEILNIPGDEMERFSESCEWIREKMASLRDLISRPYSDILQSL